MDKITISDDDIRQWVSSKSYERGFRYYKNNVVDDAKRQEMMIKAYCHGSMPQPYRVSVQFDADGIAEADCSCPVGSGGHCKHVAALLLTYLNDSDEFREIEEVDEILEHRSKEDLIYLIKEMLDRRPELENLLEVVLPVDRLDEETIDPVSYRNLAASAFHQSQYSWYGERGIADQLHSIIRMGAEFIDKNENQNAAIVYEQVALEVIDNYEMIGDEEGEIGSVVNACVEKLGECLSEISELEVRERIIMTLFDIYEFDVEFGGVGLSDEVPDVILDAATSQEKEMVAKRLSALLSTEKKDDWGSSWHRRAYGGFLLDLKKDRLTDDEYMKICRMADRTIDLVDKLLSKDQVNEAIIEAKDTSDYDLLSIADVFVNHNHGKIAKELIEKRLNRSDDDRLLNWLKTNAETEGDFSQALQLSMTLFQNHKSLSTYQDLRRIAQKLNKWDSLRKELIKNLSDEKQYELLTRIYMDEKHIDLALKTVKQIPMDRWNFPRFLLIEVAKASEQTKPFESIRLYSQMAEHFIELRGRNNYQTACTYLSKAKRVYQQINDIQQWNVYIESLRDEHDNLPAFLDELSKARL
ncbi:MAG TPA: SWIM zinc finger family protein [Candidatus Thermoplasmatota archaeon]|nr:SWIM zinc finger family protein [Candidatus Thermoplasmatota archaeon]